MKRLALLALPLALACGSSEAEPRGQLLLYVDTDTAVPRAAGDPSDELRPPLFDTLLVEAFEPGELEPCQGCVREFAVDRQAFERGAVSVGIPLPPGRDGYRARITLYRSASQRLGDPPPAASLQTVTAVPSVAETGIVECHVVLETDQVGVPQGTLESPVEARPGKPGPSRVGSWRGAQRTDCGGTPPQGAVCVPGGAFWMGSTQDGNVERLVMLSPFYVEATEVTVARFREHGSAEGVLGWSGGDSGASVEDFCTFTATAGPNDAHPVNCLTLGAARAYCQALGGDLPTEAQYEYVARGLRSDPYVWGSDTPACGDAVFGRGGFGLFASHQGVCNPEPPGGAMPVGSGRRDRLSLPGGEIVDIVANVSEYCRDSYQPVTGPFWSRPTLFENPLCEDASGPGLPVGRGGHWIASFVAPVSEWRSNAGSLSSVSPNGGFRCVWPG